MHEKLRLPPTNRLFSNEVPPSNPRDSAPQPFHRPFAPTPKPISHTRTSEVHSRSSATPN
eukprot:11971874-Alexandrium_andersonii.AAC.1